MALRLVVYANNYSIAEWEDPELPQYAAQGWQTTADLAADLAGEIGLSAERTQTLGCRNLADFLRHLREIKRRGQAIGEMTVSVHGGDGFLIFGNNILRTSTLHQITNEDIAPVFAQNARINILGCSLVMTADGELFFAKFARHLLKANGGEMYASKDTVHYLLIPGHEFTYTTGLANWVKASVSRTGVVTLSNHQFLDSELIRTRLLRARTEVRTIPGTMVAHKSRAVLLLARIESSLARGRRTSYTNLWTAHRLLTDVQDIIDASAPERPGSSVAPVPGGRRHYL